MKKLWFLFLLVFVPLVFIGCSNSNNPSPEKIAETAFSRLQDMTSYSCTITYTKDGKEIQETCLYEELFEHSFYYYSHSTENELDSEYWLNYNTTYTTIYKEIDDELTYSFELGSGRLTYIQDEISDKFYLLKPSAFKYQKEAFALGKLEENGDLGDYKYYLDGNTFIIENNEICEIQHKNYNIKYSLFDAKKLPYPDFSKSANSQESEGKQTFDEVIDKLNKLETLAQTYITQNNLDCTKKYLALNYIRSGKSSYCTTTWNSILGSINSNFINYVQNNEGEDNITSLRSTQTLLEPYKNNEIDFMHLIAVMSFADKCGINVNATDLGGFGGDIAQLTLDIKDVEDKSSATYAIALEKFCDKNSGFSYEDYCADIAAINIVADIKNNNALSLGDAIKNYYYANHDTSFATRRFISLLYIPAIDIETAENYLISRLERNTYITIWLNQNGAPITNYSTHFESCVRVFVNLMRNCL